MRNFLFAVAQLLVWAGVVCVVAVGGAATVAAALVEPFLPLLDGGK